MGHVIQIAPPNWISRSTSVYRWPISENRAFRLYKIGIQVIYPLRFAVGLTEELHLCSFPASMSTCSILSMAVKKVLWYLCCHSNIVGHILSACNKSDISPKTPVWHSVLMMANGVFAIRKIDVIRRSFRDFLSREQFPDWLNSFPSQALDHSID